MSIVRSFFIALATMSALTACDAKPSTDTNNNKNSSSNTTAAPSNQNPAQYGTISHAANRPTTFHLTGKENLEVRFPTALCTKIDGELVNFVAPADADPFELDQNLNGQLMKNGWVISYHPQKTTLI